MCPQATDDGPPPAPCDAQLPLLQPADVCAPPAAAVTLSGQGFSVSSGRDGEGGCARISHPCPTGEQCGAGGLQEGAPSQEEGRAPPIPGQCPHSSTEHLKPTPQIRKLARRKKPARHPGVWCVTSRIQHPVLSVEPQEGWGERGLGEEAACSPGVSGETAGERDDATGQAAGRLIRLFLRGDF